MEKKNIWLMALAVILSLVLGGVSGYFVSTKINKDNTKKDDVIEKDNNSDDVVNYSFGDKVIISKMSMVKGFEISSSYRDFSLWYVLSDKDNIVTLYSDAIWSKHYEVVNYKDLFKEYGVTIENMRGLNEDELKMLGCDITTLTCNNTPEWAKSSITSVVSEKSVILFEKDKLSTMPNDGTALALVRPVITITKSNLALAK